MGQTLDGISATPSQNGARIVSFPLLLQCNYYARRTRRSMLIAPATGYQPIAGDRASFTNVLTYSEAFDNAAWTKTNTTVSADAVANPQDGGVTSDSLLETATTANHQLSQAPTYAIGTYTLLVAAKANGRNYLRMLATDSAAGSFQAFFDLSNGAVFSQSGATASISGLGNGWYVCRIVFTTTASGAGTAVLQPSTDGSTTSYAGDVTKGLYLYGATLAKSSSTVPYISTTAATRAVTVPTVDVDDPYAFIVDEQEPDTGNLEFGVAKWLRIYERVPATTKTVSSITLAKPTLNTAPTSGTYLQSVASYRVFQPDVTIEQYDAYLAETVTSDSGAPSFYPTGGTYTLSLGGATTGALAYNATSGAVQTALNALTPVINRGGLTVTGTYNSNFVVTFTGLAAISYGTGSITVDAGSPTALTWTNNSGFTQTVSIQGTLPTLTDFGVTGGTYTITVGANTTAAIAYNATPATIQTALNLLTSVTNRGGCTVSGDGWNPGLSRIFFTINFTSPAPTGDASSLTPAPSSVRMITQDSIVLTTWVYFSGGSSTRTIYSPAHGIAATDAIYLKDGTTYYTVASGLFTVADSNTLILTVYPYSTYANASTITEVGRRTKSPYKPGTITVRSIQSTAYYLTGYTPGIATDSDIPLPTNQSEAVAILQAIFAGSGTINYVVGQLERYYGPIYMLTTTTINAADL